MNDILKVIQKDLKIDFSSTILIKDSGVSVDDPFELNSKDFLRFAKTDIIEKDERGFVNSLTNAKRAIDCQVDTALSIFGISFDEIKPETNRIINLTGNDKIDISHKFKLIQALDFAPSILISEIRTIRNKLEHYYNKPTLKEVNKAIELAQLFLLAIDNRINIVEEHFTITDENNYIEDWECKNGFDIHFHPKNKQLKLTFQKDKKIIEKIELSENDEEFYAIIKLINNIKDEIDMENSLKIFLKMIDHPIPQEKIKLQMM